MASGYDEIYGAWKNNPQSFWANAAEDIHWTKTWDKVLDDSRPPFYKWFSGAETNTCYNAVDRHVEAGRGHQAAIIYDSPITDSVRIITYTELQIQVARCAGMMLGLGVKKGDRVIIYMPMIPEAVIGMLACARVGAVHSVVFGGFAAKELAARIDDATPKLVLSASCGIEVDRIIPYKPLLDEALDRATHKPDRALIVQREQLPVSLDGDRELDWYETCNAAEPAACIPVSATDPLYILYTSGTTGIPKGVVRDNGGHAVALNWSMEHVYGIGAGEVFWAASDIGWVVGHSYIVYGPLLRGATTVLYEGKPVGTPDPGAFWRVVEQHHVSVLFTAPTAFRAMKKEDPDGAHMRRYDLSRFRTLFLAGERCDPDTLVWAENQLSVPVIDHWWQTETGWPIAANCVGLGILPVKPGSPTKMVPGYDVRILNEQGDEVPVGAGGEVVIRAPNVTRGYLNRPDENAAAFQDDWFHTGDVGRVDEEGYLFLLDRKKDMVITGGENVYTSEVEAALYQHEAVHEAAVVGVPDAKYGEALFAVIVKTPGATLTEDDIITHCRERIGGYKVPRRMAFVEEMPKSAMGKILKNELRRIYGD